MTAVGPVRPKQTRGFVGTVERWATGGGGDGPVLPGPWLYLNFKSRASRARRCEAGRGVSRLDKPDAREKWQQPNTRDNKDEYNNSRKVTETIVNGNTRSRYQINAYFKFTMHAFVVNTMSKMKSSAQTASARLQTLLCDRCVGWLLCCSCFACPPPSTFWNPLCTPFWMCRECQQ